MKTKALLVAATMLTAASANAAWDTGASFDTGNGEFVLSAWDNVRQLSYTQDLGLRFGQANTNAVIAVDAAAFSIFGGNFNGVSWNVGAANNFTAGFTDFSTYGVVHSAFSPTVPAIGFGDLENAYNQFNTYQASLGAGIGSIASNSAYTADANTDPTWAGDGKWGDNFNGSVPNGTSGISGSLLNLNWLGLDANTFEGTSSLVGNVQFNMAAGEVIFNASTGGGTSPVPVPAAAWLLASGLAGLGTVARPAKTG